MHDGADDVASLFEALLWSMTRLEESAIPSTPESVDGSERGVQAWTAKRAVLITTGANLLMSVLGVFTGVVAARLLGPKGRGELAAIQAWPSALAALALLGTSEAVLYFCARAPLRRAQYLGAALLIGTIGALVFSLAGFFAMPRLLASQSHPAALGGARIPVADLDVPADCNADRSTAGRGPFRSVELSAALSHAAMDGDICRGLAGGYT